MNTYSKTDVLIIPKDKFRIEKGNSKYYLEAPKHPRWCKKAFPYSVRIKSFGSNKITIQEYNDAYRRLFTEMMKGIDYNYIVYTPMYPYEYETYFQNTKE